MPLSRDDIKGTYPLPVYNYRVEIGAEAVAFSEVAGLSIGYETTVYKESPTAGGSPGPRTMQMPAQRTMPTITLKKGIVRATSIKHLYDWIKTVQINQIEKKDVFVRLCDEKGKAVISWKINNAFPTKLDAPSFDAKSNDAAIESMELKADFITLEES
jgi:phage tail-like protein